MIYLAGPGHGGPALVGHAYLEGTYSEVYPQVTQDVDGAPPLCRRFSTPGGIPSHVSVQTPGSIHEGGELGYVLSHAFGAAFDNPDLIVRPSLATARRNRAAGRRLEEHCVPQSRPRRRRAARSCISTATRSAARPCWAATATTTSMRFLRGNGYDARFVEGDDPHAVHQAFAATLDACYEQIRAIQDAARSYGSTERPRWPAIVLRTPKGWTGPKEIGGHPVEGTFRSHQVPMADVRRRSRAAGAASRRGCVQYRPEELFDDDGRLAPGAGRPLAEGRPADERQPPRQRRPAAHRPRRPRLPGLRRRGRAARRRPTGVHPRARQAAARHLRAQRRRRRTSGCSAPTKRTPTGSATCSRSRTAASSARTLTIDDHLAPDGRVMEVLSEHLCEGWLEGYTLTGRHGLFATYEAFAMVSASMTVQHTKWLQEAGNLPWRAPVASLNILLHLDVLAQRPQRVQPPGSGPDRRDALEARHRRAHLPASRCQLPAVGRRPLPAQPQLREPDRDRQAAAAAVPRHRDGHPALRAAARRSGSGPAR